MRPVAADPTILEVPDFSLVVLVGATGSGKSTFAARWFAPTEVVSSDRCRAMVADSESDQSATADAFDLVRSIAEKRLKNRRLAVVDATNVRAADRKPWIELARRWHALPVAVVLDPGLDVCVERNKARPDRDFGPGVPQRMIQEIRRGAGGLQREGFRQVWRLSSAEAIEAARVERRPLWTDRREDAGPFDIIGDVHGCAAELRDLLAALGYAVEGGAPPSASRRTRKGASWSSWATWWTAGRGRRRRSASPWPPPRPATPTWCRGITTGSWRAGWPGGRSRPTTASRSR